MYLIAHQDDCQMVTGGAVIHGMDAPIASDTIPKQTITFRIERGAGFRYCTCEPQQINWGKLLNAIGGRGKTTLADLYE